MPMLNPEQTAVMDWVDKSTPRFNNALQQVIQAEIDDMEGAANQIGWESIGAKTVFTGKMYCEEATGAYMKALRKKFPFLGALEPVWLLPDSTNLVHTVLRMTISGFRFVLDGTYGQINKAENQVLVLPWKNTTTTYKPSPIELSETNYITNRRKFCYRFEERGLFALADVPPALLGRGPIFPINGQTQNPVEFLAKHLLKE